LLIEYALSFFRKTLETQLVIAAELDYIEGAEQIQHKLNDVLALLGGLLRSLKT
jgi:hypothetical protein